MAITRSQQREMYCQLHNRQEILQAKRLSNDFLLNLMQAI